MKYIIFILLISINSLAFPNETSEDALREAGDNLGRAIYIKYNGDVYAKNFVELVLNKQYWKYVTPAIRIGRIAVERKVTFTYVF